MREPKHMGSRLRSYAQVHTYTQIVDWGLCIWRKARRERAAWAWGLPSPLGPCAIYRQVLGSYSENNILICSASKRTEFGEKKNHVFIHTP